MKKLMIVFCLFASTWAVADTTSTLYEEFLKRDQKKLTADEGAVMQFLRSLKYDVHGIVEMDILSPSTTFVLRDRNDDVCFGDTEKQILRCKNKMGITGVLFQGDAD